MSDSLSHKLGNQIPKAQNPPKLSAVVPMLGLYLFGHEFGRGLTDWRIIHILLLDKMK
jgi:hypothetical protein